LLAAGANDAVDVYERNAAIADGPNARIKRPEKVGVGDLQNGCTL